MKNMCGIPNPHIAQGIVSLRGAQKITVYVKSGMRINMSPVTLESDRRDFGQETRVISLIPTRGNTER